MRFADVADRFKAMSTSRSGCDESITLQIFLHECRVRENRLLQSHGLNGLSFRYASRIQGHGQGPEAETGEDWNGR